jgi:diguanylate cyclase (GGDEF)-like protein
MVRALFLCLLILLCLISRLVSAAEDVDSALEEVERVRHVDMPKAVTLIDALESRFAAMTQLQQARLLIYKAVARLFAADYREALQLLARAESLTRDPATLSNIANYQATIYLATLEYELALGSMSKQLSFVGSLKDAAMQRQAFLRLANLYHSMELMDEAGTYATKALELAQEDDYKDICSARLHLAAHDLGKQHHAKAIEDFQAVRDYCERHGLPLYANIAQMGMGDASLQLGEFAQALPLLQQALAGYQRFEFQHEISRAHGLLAQAYLALGDEASAAHHAQQVLSFAEEPTYTQHKLMAYEVLSKLAARQGRYERAYAYSLLQQHYKQLLLDETKVKALAYQATRFDSEEKAREIRLLNQERELYLAQQRVKEREHTNMLMFVTLLSGGVFILGGLSAVGMLQKRKFMRLAKMDGLTGIYNRSAGQDLAEDIFIQVLARGADYSLILFDLDHFKQINDSHGHGTGDWALKKVVEVLRSEFRAGDIFARIGGEEFAIMLPFADEHRALQLAEHCRKKIAAIDTRLSGHSFSLSASFGVSSLGDSDLSLDPLFHRADMALYGAKNSGRNRVMAYVAEMGASMSPSSVAVKAQAASE